MPADQSPRKLSTAALTARMMVYYTVFLGCVLVLVPWGCHKLSFIYPAAVHNFLQPQRHLLGGAVILFGFAAYTYCSLWLVVKGRGPFVEFDPPREFVADGPYRWVRNPIVLMLLVTVLGEALYFGSAGIWGFFIAGLIFAHYQATRIEEPRLKQRFGPAYEDYCRRVPRWLPRPPRNG